MNEKLLKIENFMSKIDGIIIILYSRNIIMIFKQMWNKKRNELFKKIVMNENPKFFFYNRCADCAIYGTCPKTHFKLKIQFFFAE